uniref:Uncharacterized protein n=1 Tax=Oryza punctata TaxID=4537 RepID=A0A0E0LD10_ORYPU
MWVAAAPQVFFTSSDPSPCCTIFAGERKPYAMSSFTCGHHLPSADRRARRVRRRRSTRPHNAHNRLCIPNHFATSSEATPLPGRTTAFISPKHAAMTLADSMDRWNHLRKKSQDLTGDAR